jgi:hypothetical protein
MKVINWLQRPLGPAGWLSCSEVQVAFVPVVDTSHPCCHLEAICQGLGYLWKVGPVFGTQIQGSLYSLPGYCVVIGNQGLWSKMWVAGVKLGSRWCHQQITWYGFLLTTLSLSGSNDTNVLPGVWPILSLPVQSEVPLRNYTPGTTESHWPD